MCDFNINTRLGQYRAYPVVVVVVVRGAPLRHGGEVGILRRASAPAEARSPLHGLAHLNPLVPRAALAGKLGHGFLVAEREAQGEHLSLHDPSHSYFLSQIDFLSSILLSALLRGRSVSYLASIASTDMGKQMARFSTYIIE